MKNLLLAVALLTVAVTGAVVSPQAANKVEHATNTLPSDTTITKILRGKTVCTIIIDTSQICGIEYWSVYVHQDGTRTMHVASETTRNGEVRHAVINVDADGTPYEAYMHNRTKTGMLGSTIALLKDEQIDTVISDSGFELKQRGLTVSDIEADMPIDSISAGPAAADGLHFLKYDFSIMDKQERNLYWMGGSRRGSMLGSVRPTTHTYLGEVELTLPNGSRTLTDHFQMMTGTEIWLTKEGRVVVRMEPRFGKISGTRYDLIQYEVIEFGP